MKQAIWHKKPELANRIKPLPNSCQSREVREISLARTLLDFVMVSRIYEVLSSWMYAQHDPTTLCVSRDNQYITPNIRFAWQEGKERQHAWWQKFIWDGTNTWRSIVGGLSVFGVISWNQEDLAPRNHGVQGKSAHHDTLAIGNPRERQRPPDSLTTTTQSLIPQPRNSSSENSPPRPKDDHRCDTEPQS